MNPILHNIALAEKTTLRIGGNAAHFSAAGTRDEIRDLAQWAKKNDLPVLVLGNGSNMLISDKGWPGLAIEMRSGSGICWTENQARCASGEQLARLARQSVERGLAGMENLAGIPGTVGGGLVMNAGAFGQEISDCLVSADIFDLNTIQHSSLSKPDIEFGYRTSSLKRDGVLVLDALFEFKKGNAEELNAAYKETLEKRALKQPLDMPNCGSVFKRPAGAFAGTLIEQCGLKGMRIGDAMVSPKHANFIVNTGVARAEDVRRLIAHIQKKVYESAGVLLEPEVVFAGNFSTPLFVP